MPAHVQWNGAPAPPDTCDACPALHRPDAGAVDDDAPTAHKPALGALATPAPSAGPHTPSTGAFGAAHDASAPPATPAHVHENGPLPLTDDGAPTEHSPDVGALAVATPFAEPHAA